MSNDNISISAEQFVDEFAGLRQSLLSLYFSHDSEISRHDLLLENGFTAEQIELTKSIASDVLKDALYTVLLGLDGAASINKAQITYKLLDENSNEITGDLEGIAWERFHADNT